MGGITALKLEFNRTWSVPRDKVPDDAAIAAVLARPTFNDMMMICWTLWTQQTNIFFFYIISNYRSYYSSNTK